MAANGLINGGRQVQPPLNFGGEALKPGGIWAERRHGSFPQGNMSYFNDPDMAFGAPQYDEGVDQIAEAFKTYLTNNPHADRNAPNIDTFDAFRAGVEFGRTPPVEEFGKPYVPPNVDEFEGIATEGTPGNVNPDYRQQPPSSFSLDPNDPRNAHLNQGIPGQMQPTEDFRIDMSDILGTPRG